MSTFLQLQDQTIALLTDITNLDSGLLSRELVKLWINEGYDEIQSTCVWPWSLKEGTDTLTVSDSDLAVPADFVTMVSVFNSTRGWEMMFIDSRQAWTEDESTNTGSPTHYRRVGDNWDVWPMPDAAEVIKMRYVYAWTALSADGDTPVIPSMFHDLLRNFAVMRGLEHLNSTRQDAIPTAQAGQALYRRHWEEGLAKMKSSWATDETLDIVHSHQIQQDVLNYDW